MNIKPLAIVAICVTMAACSNNSTVPNRIELPGTIDNEAFAANVESISVMNLQMDDDLALTQQPHITITDNYIYLLDNPINMGQSRLRLMCFDKQTGEKLSARSIEGRGPQEVVSVPFINTLNIGDTIGVHSMSDVKFYDSNCRFVGKLDNLEKIQIGMEDRIIRLKNGKFILSKPFNRDDHYLQLLDESFNVVSKHFETIPYNNSGMDYRINNDTIRFVFSPVNQIFSFYGDTEQITELVVPNLITPEIYQNSMAEYNPLRPIQDGYDGLFQFWGESGRFLLLTYYVDKQWYKSVLDKYANKAISFHLENLNKDDIETADIFNALISYPYFSDGKYLYTASKIGELAKKLEGHDDVLDDRLKKTQAEYRAYLERNAEYIKGLEPDERDAATVLLKIKLKD